jgi:hypothetical protein
MYVPFSVLCVLFVCKCALYCYHRVLTQLQLNITSHHITSHHILSYHIISYHIISYHIISYHIISYHTISYHIISYHIISYHIISYRWKGNLLNFSGYSTVCVHFPQNDVYFRNVYFSLQILLTNPITHALKFKNPNRPTKG